MARREARPPARARSAPDPTERKVRELWRAIVGSLPRPAYADDVPRFGPPATGGAALPQPGVCVVPSALSRRRRRGLGTASREFGLDIITVIGQLRYGEHRSIPEIHQRLLQHGVIIAQRTVTERHGTLRGASRTAPGR